MPNFIEIEETFCECTGTDVRTYIRTYERTVARTFETGFISPE